MSKKKSLNNSTQPVLVDKVPEGYTPAYVDPKLGQVHKMDVTLPQATNTSMQTTDPDAYFEQMKQKVAGGVDPNHLAEQGYISKDYVSKLQPFYQQKLVYTQPISNTPDTPSSPSTQSEFTPIQSYRSDIKLQPKRDASTPFDAYTIPDLNGQANNSQTVYIHPKTGQELDMNKYLKTGNLDQSINDNGRNLDYYKSLKRSEGTGGTYLPNNGTKTTIKPMQQSESNTKAYSGGFKTGGLVSKFKRKGYEYGGDIEGGGFTGGEFDNNSGGFGSDNGFSQYQGNNNQYANNYQSVPNGVPGNNKGNDTYSNKFNLGKNMPINNSNSNNPTNPNYTSAQGYSNYAKQQQETNQINQEADQGISQIPGFGAYYGAAKAGEGIGKSALPKDANGNVQGQTNQALNTLFTPTHEQIIDDFSAGNSTGTTMGVANLLTGGGAQNISALGAGIFGNKSSVGKFFTKAANAGVNENPELQKQTKYNPKTGLYETTNYTLKKQDDSFARGGLVGKFAKDGGVPYNKSLAELKNKSDSTDFRSGYEAAKTTGYNPELGTYYNNPDVSKKPFDSGYYRGQRESEDNYKNKLNLTNQQVLDISKNGIENHTFENLSQADKNRILKAQKYAKGGLIKGPGTPKSDSIKANVEANSFVVPAENVGLAKKIKKEVLGKNPNEMADLKGGETPVKLSDTELIFTPSERYELMRKGIDLNKLAPNAVDTLKNHLKSGGTVKSYIQMCADGGDVYDDDLKARLAKAKKIEDEKLAKETANSPYRNKSIPNYNELISGKPTALATKISVPTNTKSEKPTVKKSGLVNKVSKTPSLEEQLKFVPSNYDPSEENIVIPNLKPTFNPPASYTIGATPNPYPTQQSAPAKNSTSSRFNGLDYGSLIGLGQSALGAVLLAKSGKRPVDSLDPVFQSQLAKSIAMSNYGYTPEQKSLLNENATEGRNNALQNVYNASGGNGSVALNNVRQVFNDSYKNRLENASNDEMLRLQKQGQANQMAAQDQEYKRRLFGDKMNQFQQNQAAYSSLLGSGLENLIGSQRYSQQKNAQDQLDKINSY